MTLVNINLISITKKFYTISLRSDHQILEVIAATINHKKNNANLIQYRFS
jgi:hypothetical protein